MRPIFVGVGTVLLLGAVAASQLPKRSLKIGALRVPPIGTNLEKMEKEWGFSKGCLVEPTISTGPCRTSTEWPSATAVFDGKSKRLISFVTLLPFGSRAFNEIPVPATICTVIDIGWRCHSDSGGYTVVGCGYGVAVISQEMERAFRERYPAFCASMRMMRDLQHN